MRCIGILGGMGPAATVDLMAKIIAATPAQVDQAHVPMVAVSIPQIPDRIAGLRGTGPSPVPAMQDAVRRLELAGAEGFAIACNTAHAWADELTRATTLPFIHMADAVLEKLPSADAPLALLATDGTLMAGFYQSRLASAGRQMLAPNVEEQKRVMEGVRAVKAGALEEAKLLIAPVAYALLARGASKVILGCTEIPLALARDASLAESVLDATQALAEACVKWSHGSQMA
jgi:aspartate racemase